MELKVETRNVDLRKSWQDKIDVEKEKLVRHHGSLVLRLRVSIESNTNHKDGGYEVKLVVSIPNDTVVVGRKGEIVKPLLTEAFDVLALQLKEIQRKKRTVKKAGGGVSVDKTGVIKMISPGESFGFIADIDEREIYFHENALKNTPLDNLNVGDGVYFAEETGDNGPQATWVRTL
ncbi:MAG: cold shock domain-containing protein [Desulfotalea sp.]